MKATSKKLAALNAAKTVRQGGLIAHYTDTLPGIAAHPRLKKSIQSLCRFKQRQGPFLLLADSIQTATKQIRFFSPALRRLIKTSWPGPVTIIVQAKPGLSKQCYNKASMAIRVDASMQTRQLAHACGGLLLSSSLNRRSKGSMIPDRKNQYRLHRLLRNRLAGDAGTGKASTILRVWRNDSTMIRP
ncbi:L-threonylcarbamoyladenylate synthase [Mariprofundus micogutta]|uniref:L-threonylcarbamoyladenylate synthase n=1 Tax=Mariprofundus micogutta TaxID=1921010 RepID=A0A1L8CMT2_9PROT|nr:Sua5/YciO/YrdC/YwlC family protein [Mariprofundus micogutta]GAV20216.1 L-threonylcarbamoyladenylate synthase [Mariprofundus micogutta]